MKKLVVLFFFTIFFYHSYSQNVSISENKFVVGDSEIWFNGINTPWHLFDDFGRTDFNPTWWDEEFAKYQKNHINLARVWIYGSGEVSPYIDESGYVTGASNLYWEHMDYLMEIAEKYKVYVMPALFSFDITKSTNPKNPQWRAFLQSESNIQSYIDNVLIPMVKRYNSEPYLLGWEICNEPEWMFNNDEHGPQSFYDVQKLHAMLAAAIHENCTTPVTTGSAAPKWNSPIYDNWGDYEGNMFSDDALSSAINNDNAYLDFYQYHWYPWQSEWMDSPFTKTTAEYEVDDRPVIVGESEGNDVCDNFICQTVTEMYESAYQNGFDGVCAWKTPQNDGHGTFENISVATNAFYNNHPALVNPDGSATLYSLIVNVKGSGSVSPSSGTYTKGASVTLTANPDNGYDFAGWSDDAHGTALETTITMDTDKVVTATFVLDTVIDIYTLDIDIVGQGSVSPEGGEFEEGSSITLKATPDDGYYFSSWSGDISGSAESITFTIDHDMSISATFLEEGSYCESPVEIQLPYSQDGIGEYCWVSSDDISYINSWNMDTVEVNGIDYTNVFATLPPLGENEKYYIHYHGSYNWSHLEIASLKNTAPLANTIKQEITLFPNPFTEVINIQMANPESIKSIEIIDNSGRLIKSFGQSSISTKLFIGKELVKGLYIMRINTTESTHSYKINKM